MQEKHFKERMMRWKKVREIARKCGFDPTMCRPDQCLVRFRRDDTTIDVWYSKMTVGVYQDDSDQARYMYTMSMDDLFELMMSPSTYKHDYEKITTKYNKS